jgi:hypothetical protein
MDMVGQEVLCPICGTQFHLRYEDSIEYKEEQAERRRQRAENLNQTALKWSIGTAVAIVLAILIMIIVSAVRSHKGEDYQLPEPEPDVTAPADPAKTPAEKPATPSPATPAAKPDAMP